MSDDSSFSVQQALLTTTAAVEQFLAEPVQVEKLEKMGQWMVKVFAAGNKMMACGNGGSACQAMHYAEELTGRYCQDRRALPALALADASHITCVGNDYGFDQIFSRSVAAYGAPGDGLLLLSTSGDSENIIQAVKAAQVAGVTTAALLGRDGGRLAGLCDFEVIVSDQRSDCVQNIHMMLIHILIEQIERALFPELYQSMSYA